MFIWMLHMFNKKQKKIQMKHLLKKAKARTILILMLSLIGCEKDDNNLPKVIAGFTYTLNADTGTVTFINISENAGSYTWDFGDGGTSNEINPIKTYANGTYTVTLKASNASGASATFEDIIIISIPNPITLPVTFDDPNVIYDVATFGGTSFEILDNPDVSGTNDKATKVGAITNSGAAFEGINFDLGTQLDLTTKKTITMNFWADAPVHVLLKLEQGTGPDIEVTASHGGTGWEVISFDFNSSNKYVRVTVFVDGPGTTAGTFYIDDIIQIETPPATCTPDPAQSLAAADFNLTFKTDPGASIGSFDAVLTRISNPDADNAVNTSCQVGQIVRNGGALFANNQIEFDAKLDFNANAGFKMKVWSPEAGTNVLVKLEDKTNSGVNVEVGALTTKAGDWEELTFDFGSAESGKYDKIIVFFELNTNTTETYYIDDFRLYDRAGGGTACTPDSTQSLAAADFNLTFKTDPGAGIGSFDAVLTTIPNPDFENAVNPSCQVGQIVRNGGALFANNQIEFNSKLDFNANAGFKMKVWSPRAGTNVLMKLEDKNNTGINVEVAATTTSAGAWQELTFNFASAESGKYDRIVVFFELNTNTTETYYIDDFRLYDRADGGTACTPETTESLNAADFNLTFMTNSVTVIEDNATYVRTANPEEDAVNSSCFVGVVTNLNQNPWDNIQIDLNAKLDFNANAGFKIKVYSLKAGTKVTIKLEEIGNPGNNTEVGVARTKTGEWEELTVPFPSSASGKFNKIVLFFDLESRNGDTYYFDDLKLYPRTGGGGGATGEFAENGDFETGNLDGWAVYTNGGIIIADNTQSNGGEWSAKIVASSPAGLNPTLKQERKGAGSIAVGDIVQIKFDYKGSAAGGGIYDIRSFVEAENGVNQTEIFPVTPTDTWQTFTTTYTVNAGNVSGGITIQFTAICGGVPGCSSTLYLDNVSIILNP